MSNKWVNSGGYYTLLSTDITSGSWVESAGDDLSFIGAPVLATDTGDTYRVTARHTITKVAQQVINYPDLTSNAKNLTLVLSGSKASAPILDNATVVGLFTSSSTVRVGFSVLAELSGSSSGSAASASDFKSGFTLPTNAWKYFNVGKGVSRTLYFASGSPADTVQIVQS